MNSQEERKKKLINLFDGGFRLHKLEQFGNISLSITRVPFYAKVD